MMIFVLIINLMLIYLNLNFNSLKIYFFSNLNFLLSLYFFMKFYFNIDWTNITYMFSLNNYNFMLLILVIWIFSLVYLILGNLKNLKLCMNILICLEINLILNFMIMDLIMFYLFFEISLFFTFYLIMKWGVGFKRILASYYLLFYTMFFSIPFLFYLFYMIYEMECSIMMLIELIEFNLNSFMFIYMLLTFFIKIPLYLLHSWLLKAHVEAPVFGSMILASILLKLGTYGLLRFILMFMNNFLKINWIFLVISLLGSLILSILCLRQIDLKILVAYSSIVHMSILIMGLMSLMKLGFMGAYYMMLAHGICSSGMFYMVNLFYEQTCSRLLIINKGLINLIPSLSMMWFLLCSSNMAAPFSLNLVSEILLMISIFIWMKYIMWMMIFMSFFSFTFSMYMYCFTQHGELSFFLKLNNGKLLKFMVILIHWLMLNLMMFNLFF